MTLSHLVGLRLSGAALVASAVALLAATPAAVATPRVRTCSAKSVAYSPSVGRVLSVRAISCRGAMDYYLRHKGVQNVPTRKGQVTRIGAFSCRVYQDLTPPGPSDLWVRIRCTDRHRAFRLEYGV